LVERPAPRLRRSSVTNCTDARSDFHFNCRHSTECILAIARPSRRVFRAWRGALIQKSKKRPPQPGGCDGQRSGVPGEMGINPPGPQFYMHVSGRPARSGAARLGTGFQRPSFNGSHSNRALASPAFGGCSFLRDGRGESHSAVQRIPRSHSSASLRSKSALALSFSARASLRYRTERALLMGISNPTQQNKDSSTGKRFWFRAAPNRFRSALGSGRPDSFSEAGRYQPRPEIPDSPAAFLESCRGHRALCFKFSDCWRLLTLPKAK
jgi:hypothetical protein